jgi:hypothetical protein
MATAMTQHSLWNWFDADRCLLLREGYTAIHNCKVISLTKSEQRNATTFATPLALASLPRGFSAASFADNSSADSKY